MSHLSLGKSSTSSSLTADFPYISLSNRQISLSPSREHRLTPSRLRLCELIFLSVAISVGCLCYLTIYYQLTSSEEYDSPPPLVLPRLGGFSHQGHNDPRNTNQHQHNHQQQRHHHRTSVRLDTSAGPIEFGGPELADDINDTELDSADDDDTAANGEINNQIILSQLPEPDGPAHNNQIVEGKNRIELSHDPLFGHLDDHSAHVSEFLSDSVQLLTVKAKYRFELAKQRVENVFKDYIYKLLQTPTCKTNHKIYKIITKSSLNLSNSSTNPLETLSQDPLSVCDVIFIVLDSSNSERIDNHKSALISSNEKSSILLESSIFGIKHENKTVKSKEELLHNQNNIYIAYFDLINRVIESPSEIICDLFASVKAYSAFTQTFPYSALCPNSSIKHTKFNANLTNQQISTEQSKHSIRSNIRVVVLISSLNPLRAFVYDENSLIIDIKISNDQKVQDQIRNSIYETIAQTLIILDISDRLISIPVYEKFESEFLFKRFQILVFDLSLTYDHHVQVMSIKDLFSIRDKNMEHGKILHDLVDFYYAVPNRAQLSHLQAQMDTLLEREVIGLLGVNCLQSHLACLSESDLHFLLQTAFESIASTRFTLLYPTNGDADAIYRMGKLFDDILTHLDEKEDDKISKKHSKTSHLLEEYRTEKLHQIVRLLNFDKQSNSEKNNQAVQSNSIEEPNYSDFHDLTNINSIYSPHQDETQFEDQQQQPSVTKNHLNCSSNFEKLSYLSKLVVLEPKYLQFVPVFREDIYHYHVNALGRYEDLLLSIDLSVAHCDAWIKIENQILFQSGTLNFTLGLGENHITIGLVTSQPKQLSSYTISIYRQSRVEQYRPLHWTKRALKPQKICSLVQDCAMRVYPDAPCGLHRTAVQISTKQTNSSYWIRSFESSSVCADGAAPGRWLVPCSSCDDESSCLWDNLEWMPFNCRYVFASKTTKNDLIKCVDRKRILLIGDSTNRGIMHYLLEKFNGSLSEADKTHGTKRYDLKLDSNGIDTATNVSFTFVYYPKFWIPLQTRPSFEVVLQQMLGQVVLEEGKNLNGGQNLVFIVGGVQWIAKKHLKIIQKKLDLFGLSKAKVVIKTLGSGFHQPVNGVHFMSLSEQIKLAAHNQELIAEARQLKMGLVETFNKTIAMFRDFYPGKCACHFHKIVKGSNDPNQPNNVNNNNNNNYHVEGRLNRLYSEMVLSQICDF